ncbi:RAF-like serine/threonine-protein kinase 20 [Tasmannia lanceolata]|uniref:RAF-like serine/threonine-protein kinase 20 n=1 Tax=Tasmannia lanceolata TaxID=3420 RepID=UPI004063C802
MNRKEGFKDPNNVCPQLNRNNFLQSMASDVPGPSNNVSMQTGEEFSLEFLHDRFTPRRAFGRPDIDQDYAIRGGLNFNQNHVGYENLSAILGLTRTESECSSDVTNFALGTGKVEDKGCSNKASNVHKETRRHVPSKSLGEINWDQEVPMRETHSSDSLSEFSRGYPHCRSGALDSYQKMKFLCSFGGRILPRPSDGKLRYVGGETRIISIRKILSWEELMQKTLGICNQPHMIKYQLPGEDLDALISVSSDEDLQNMVEEYNGLEKVDGPQRLRIFLISSSESENCSFDSIGRQGNSEYHYVVAVNGIVAPSTQKSSNGHNLASQLGHYSDGSPSFHRDSRPSAAQLFMAPQNAAMSPTHSPPFSSVSPRRKDSRNTQKHSYEDHFGYGGNDNTTPSLLDQQPEKSFFTDTTYHFHGEMSKRDPNKHRDGDQPVKPRGVHFHQRTPSRDFARPTFHRVRSDLDGYSTWEKPLINERAFHSEKFQRQPEESLGLSASNDSIGSHHGMLHALSDSMLQEHCERSVYCLQEGTIAPLDFSKENPNCYENSELNCEKLTQINEKGVLWNQDENHRDSDIFIRDPVTATYQIEFPGIDNQLTGMCSIHVSSQELKVSNNMAPVSSSNASEVCPEIRQEHSLGSQKDKTTSELSFTGQRATENQQCSTSKPLNGYFRRDDSNGITSMPPFPLLNNSSKLIGLDTFPDLYSKRQYDDEILSSDLLSGLPNDLISFVSPKLQSVESQNTKASQETKVVRSVNLSPIATENDTDLGLNSHTDNHTTLSLFRNMVMDEALRRENSLAYQDPMNCPCPMGEEVDMRGCHYQPLKGEDAIIVQAQPGRSSNEQIQLESVVIVEDVTDTLPPGFGSLSPVIPHVRNETIEDVQVHDIPSEEDAESTPAESESEDVKTDDRDEDESISDAAIAEMEAGIYGLQIIKNADLEELRELGSGTFGTVYHGKWRGTDVAIKRIKKSCFAGRSSEQERLTKDFWREAQILSKLHHPNVLAFYGVVPDGAGGTLATVTEFMVNGSLRNVLLRKDRALDRRKRLIIAMDAAFGMEYLHSKNIVHFDLKCDNLLVNMRDSHRPICKVGDFGLSRIKRNTLVSGGVRGTLPWMAPELLNGSSSRVSEKVDVFSFGIAMWEILTGEEPYANMHCGAIIGGIVNNTLRPPIPDRCDPEWRKLMEQCWSPDPGARPSFTEITSKLRVMSMALPTKGNSPGVNR